MGFRNCELCCTCCEAYDMLVDKMVYIYLVDQPEPFLGIEWKLEEVHDGCIVVRRETIDGWRRAIIPCREIAAIVRPPLPNQV